jgi:hypothetical protein
MAGNVRTVKSLTNVVAPVAALMSVARRASMRTGTPAVSRTDTVPVADTRFGRPPQMHAESSTIGFGATVSDSVAATPEAGGAVGEARGPAHDSAAQPTSVNRMITVALGARMA